MNATLNRHLFTMAAFDSGSLGMLTSVIHQFQKPGRYEGVIRRQGASVGSFTFEVAESSSNMQLEIDLARAPAPQKMEGCECAGTEKTPQIVSPKGYVLFFASSGTGGYSVVVGEGGEKGAKVFDSERLENGDLFALSLLEPTRYSMVNQHGKAKGTINVTFNRDDGRRLKNLETQYVEVRRDAFQPSQVQVISTQGVVFRVRELARIVVKKTESKEKREGEERPPIRVIRQLPPPEKKKQNSNR